MKTAAPTDNITVIDSKKLLTKQELINANIKLLMSSWLEAGSQKHSPTTSRP
jgi:hypothetical protein